MLRKIILIVLIVALVACAAGIYLFKVNSAHFETSTTTVVTSNDAHSHDEAQTPADAQTVEITAVRMDGYGVLFVDDTATFVPGVVCNVCDETTCTMLTADENGVIELPGEAFPYEIQFLKVPEGYKLPDEPFIVDGETQFVTCTLERE